MSLCCIIGCGRKCKAYGYCQIHYRRIKKNIPLDRPIKGHTPFCTISGCNKKNIAHGYCSKHYQQKNRDTALKSKINIKLETFLHYSEPYIKCACCGEKNLCFLTLDHIIPIKRKKPNIPSGTHLFYKLKKLGFPKGFQVLCYNCNCAKRDNKDCPHKTGGGV